MNGRGSRPDTDNWRARPAAIVSSGRRPPDCLSMRRQVLRPEVQRPAGQPRKSDDSYRSSADAQPGHSSHRKLDIQNTPCKLQRGADRQNCFHTHCRIPPFVNFPSKDAVLPSSMNNDCWVIGARETVVVKPTGEDSHRTEARLARHRLAVRAIVYYHRQTLKGPPSCEIWPTQRRASLRIYPPGYTCKEFCRIFYGTHSSGKESSVKPGPSHSATGRSH